MSSQNHKLDSPSPRLTFGIIADVQYADHDDRLHSATNRIRYYRNGLVILRDAIRHWRSSEHRIDFILQAGDLIDRINEPDKKHDVLNNELLKIFSDLDCPTYHVLGNHELYSFPYSYIRESPINTATSLKSKLDHDGNATGMYYHFSPAAGFRVIVLNTYEVTTQGHDLSSAEYGTAMALLTSYRERAAGSSLMYNESNGAVTDGQLAWLDNVLTQAGVMSEKVLVTGHTPIHEKSADIHCICWNHDRVRSVLEQHRSIVIGYLCGHDHAGGYYHDNDIYYVTLHGVVDTPPGETCYATAHLFTDRLEIKGAGRMPDYTLRW